MTNPYFIFQISNNRAEKTNSRKALNRKNTMYINRKGTYSNKGKEKFFGIGKIAYICKPKVKPKP